MPLDECADARLAAHLVGLRPKMNAHTMRIPRQPDTAMLRYDTSARKRPVNLTLNEDLVDRAREFTDNLSGVVEGLLAEYVERTAMNHEERRRALAAAVAAWNAHGAKHGSLADEYSPL